MGAWDANSVIYHKLIHDIHVLTVYMAIVFTTDLGDKGISQSQFVYDFV